MNLQPNQISRVIEATLSTDVRRAKPVLADHCAQALAQTDCLVDHFREIRTGLDGVDVHEHGVLAKSGAQCVIQSTRVSCRVIAPVVDEDAQSVRIIRLVRESRQRWRRATSGLLFHHLRPLELQRLESRSSVGQYAPDLVSAESPLSSLKR